jgi:hypothetical protein
MFSVLSIAHLMRRRVNPELRLTEKFIEKFEPLLPHLEAIFQIPLARLLLPFGRVKNADSFINTFASSIKPHLSSLRMKDLDRTCKILQHFNYKSDMGIYEAVEEALSHCDMSDSVSGIRFISVVTHLSRVGYFSQDNIQRIIQLANHCCALPTVSDQATLAEAGRRLLNCFSPRKSSSPHTESVMSKVEVDVSLKVLARVAELDNCVEIEIPDVAGERLSPDLFRSIVSVRQRKQVTSVALTDRFDVFADVKELLRENVFHGRAFPYTHFSSILFCLHPSEPLKTLPLPRDFTDRLAAGKEAVRPPQSRGRWIALLVPSRSHLGYYGQPIGNLPVHIRQLQKLGYLPLVIYHFAYAKAKSENCSKAFIKDMILRVK